MYKIRKFRFCFVLVTILLFIILLCVQIPLLIYHTEELLRSNLSKDAIEYHKMRALIEFIKYLVGATSIIVGSIALYSYLLRKIKGKEQIDEDFDESINKSLGLMDKIIPWH